MGLGLFRGLGSGCPPATQAGRGAAGGPWHYVLRDEPRQPFADNPNQEDSRAASSYQTA